MCSPQALFALKTAKAITSTIAGAREAGDIADISAANIESIRRANVESLQNLAEQVEETRGELIKNLDRSLSRISVTAAEAGFTGVTKARLERGVAAKVQLDLTSLRKNREFAIKRLNSAFLQNTRKQQLNFIEAGARRDTAIVTGIAEIAIAGVGLKTTPDIQKKITEQRERKVVRP